MSKLYNHVEGSSLVEIRGSDQQVGNNLLYSAPLSVLKATGSAEGNTYTHQKGLAIRSFGLQNLSTTDDLQLGIGFRWANSQWVYGTWDDSAGATAFTDDTADAQDTGAGDVTLVSDTGEAANDGFIIAARRPFNWVSINVSQASTGNTTFAVRHSTTAGTAWSSAVAAGQTWKSDFIISASVIPTGELAWAWPAPSTWSPVAAGQSATFSTIPVGYFALHCFIDAATIATSALATAIEVGSIVAVKNVDASGTFGMETCNYVDYDADALVVLSSTAVTSISCYAQVESVG